MSDFRSALEQWICAGLDDRVCEALDFCLQPPLDEKVRCVQQLQDWMVLEQMCRYGLRKSVGLYLHHLRVEGEQAAWAVEVCAQHNSGSIFELLKQPQFCTSEIAQNLYHNHPLMWLKTRQHFSNTIQNLAQQFAMDEYVRTFKLTPQPTPSLFVVDWEQTRNSQQIGDACVHSPVALWAALANCPWVYAQTPDEHLRLHYSALGKEFLEWPFPYKKGKNTVDTVFNFLRNHIVDNKGTTALTEVVNTHLRAHGALGLRLLVNRFGEKDTLQLCKPFGAQLIWTVERNPMVLDGMSQIADYLHKSNIQSVATTDICYSILPYTSRAYRKSLNAVLQQCATETLQEKLDARRSLLENQRQAHRHVK